MRGTLQVSAAGDDWAAAGTAASHARAAAVAAACIVRLEIIITCHPPGCCRLPAGAVIGSEYVAKGSVSQVGKDMSGIH